MPVTLTQMLRIKTLNDRDVEGEFVAKDLVAVKVGDGFEIGTAVSQKICTTVVCDNPKCEQGKLNAAFQFLPKEITFTDTGNPAEYIKDVTEITTVADFRGEKKVFCCVNCAASYLRRTHKLEGNILHFPEKKFAAPSGIIVPDRS